jgi:hypothetical protein
MIDTLMALWNRNYRRRSAKVLLAFLLICISISLLLAIVGAPHLTFSRDGRDTANGFASQADSTSMQGKAVTTATVPNIMTTAATPIAAGTMPVRASATARIATPTTTSNAMQTCSDAPAVPTPAWGTGWGYGTGNGRSATAKKDTHARSHQPTNHGVATPIVTPTEALPSPTPEDQGIATPIKGVAITPTPVFVTPTEVDADATPPDTIFMVPTPTTTWIVPTAVSNVTPTPTLNAPSGTAPTPGAPLAPHAMVSATATVLPSTAIHSQMHSNAQSENGANGVASPGISDQRMHADDSGGGIDSGVIAKCLTDSIVMAPLPTAAALGHGMLMVIGGAFLGTILFYCAGYVISRRRTL